ncbi:helix-turn-helix transcriptional regulator [Amnibacterium setariae]|uniref:XRE family transcriptional regulator n=1 Tax=Amnibacterium setariae TaxID=2306585 RepID=A0A3A1TUB9_9MICO|nr:helix-turn-helix transcriptional regulator [Amnibacterium setariae]RIX27822.1 XRE family transcriptional regulator [Amnibacterium setariae]
MSDSRRDLGDFLRSRRARIAPEDVGLPAGGRRRTPGLRREEVAQLAGVGVTWYTWLEQGRDIRASEQVLTAVARVLRLDADERAHLLELGGFGAPTAPAAAEVDAGVRLLLERLDPAPAYVQNGRYDVLAHNPAFGRLVTDLDRLPPADRNTMWLAFTDVAWQAAMPDWEEVTARMAAQLRSQRGADADRRQRDDLVRRLTAASPRFAELWQRQDVLEPRTGRKVYISPHVGRLRFDVVTTWLQPRQGLRLVAHLPADAETARRVERLAELARR